VTQIRLGLEITQ